MAKNAQPVRRELTDMYVCANCGVEFDGKVCPNCCTMRPSAAVIVGSGSILKKPVDNGLAPGQQAARFAQELEHSRQLDAKRQAKREHDLRMRQRAAELAAAEERQRLRREQAAQKAAPPPEPEKPADAVSEEYIRQLQKAVGWKRKAPITRSQELSEDDQTVMVTDALRSLKIASAQTGAKGSAGKTAPRKKQPASKPPVQPAQITDSKLEEQMKNVPGIPASLRTPAGEKTAWSKTPNAQRIDDAWRLFAQTRAEADRKKNS